MAITGTYNTSLTNVPEIYRATSGGTVFSANLATSTDFDYFDDTAVVNDAIYFANGANSSVQSDFVFNVGTAISGTGITIVWEYYKLSVGWTAMECVQDDTVGFTVTGSNRVRFPLQWQRRPTTINGLFRMWTRCRISALTTITEGGANITNRIQFSDGRVTIAGGTDAVPATFTDLYNWCIANIPYVTVTKRTVNSFDFTKIAFEFTGRCYTTNEIIEVGADGPTSQGAGNTSINWVTSGIKVGERGYMGSTFIVYGGANSAVFTSGSQTKLYGTVIKTGKTSSDASSYLGYFNLSGEHIDGFYELSMRLDNAVVKNTRILDGIIIGTAAPVTFSGVTYITTSTLLLYCYIASFTIPDFSYQFIPTTGSLFFLYMGSGYHHQQWILTNPGTPIGLMADAIKTLTFSTNLYTNLASCKFYDSSAGTYTDYTTQASNVTADDVPLSGDIGDYYLFGIPTTLASVSTGFSLDMTITNQTNDYEYAWEVYTSGSGWITINPSYFWDGTANMTKSGKICSGANTVASTVTIDGVSAKWIRARIVAKGTSTPVASKIVQYQNSGTSGWSIKEQWSVDLKIVDNVGNAIDGATVQISNGYGSVSVATASDGTITQQLLTAKEWHFDPINNPTTLVSENLYSTFGLTISKTGYETYTESGVSLNKKVDMTISLKPVVPIRQTIDGEVLVALKPELGSSSLLTEI